MKRRSAHRLAAAQASEGSTSNPSLDLSSLIDIAFLLLIYFLVTSTLDPKEADLGFSMMVKPQPGETRSPVFESSRIALKADGSVYLNDELLEPGAPDSRKLPNLESRLKELKYLDKILRDSGSSEGAPIFLAAEDAAKGQRFMDVMDALTRSGIQSVMLEGFTE